MGRLFDAAAAVLGLRQQVRYEAEAALQLEYLADRAGEGTRRYAFALDDGLPCQADAGPVLVDLARDALAGMDAGTLAASFHVAVVDLIVALAERARAAHGVTRVGLTGGVFQNAWLARRAEAALVQAGFETLVHRLVPPNDAGLALGQAWLAMQ
jgi:hydrogenase maturation protein HypF